MSLIDWSYKKQAESNFACSNHTPSYPLKPSISVQPPSLGSYHGQPQLEIVAELVHRYMYPHLGIGVKDEPH